VKRSTAFFCGFFVCCLLGFILVSRYRADDYAPLGFPFAEELGNAESAATPRHDGRQRRGIALDIPVSANSVSDLRPCGEGFAFAAQDPTFGLASLGGPVRALQGPRTADMRGKKRTGLEISGEAATVRFGLGEGEEKPVLSISLRARSATRPAPSPASRPRAFEDLPVTDWRTATSRKFKGIKDRPQELRKGLRACGAARPLRLRARDGVVCPRLRHRGQADMGTLSLSAGSRLSSPSSCLRKSAYPRPGTGYCAHPYRSSRPPKAAASCATACSR
jgi:hypothetical protein